MLVIISDSFVAATLEARYIEELDTTIQNSTQYGIQDSGFDVALHVGTLTIDAVGGGSTLSLFALLVRPPAQPKRQL